MLLPAAWMEGPLPLRLGWIPACAGMTGPNDSNARAGLDVPSATAGPDLLALVRLRGNDGRGCAARANASEVPCPTAGTGNLSVAGFHDHPVPPLGFARQRIRGPQHTRGPVTLREGGGRERPSHRIVGRVDTRCRAPRVETAAGLRGARFGGALPSRPGFPNPGTLRHHRFPGARRSSGRVAIPGDIR